MPTVEGFTPAVLWTTIYGLFALGLLFMIAYKVYDAIRTIIERRKQKQESKNPDFAEAVSQKVIEKLEPRFKEIEKKLEQDKSRLDNHESIISGVQQAQKETRDGLVEICKYLVAMTQYGGNGSDSEKMKNATAEMMQYLATKIGGNAQ